MPRSPRVIMSVLTACLLVPSTIAAVGAVDSRAPAAALGDTPQASFVQEGAAVAGGGRMVKLEAADHGGYAGSTTRPSGSTHASDPKDTAVVGGAILRTDGSVLTTIGGPTLPAAGDGRTYVQIARSDERTVVALRSDGTLMVQTADDVYDPVESFEPVEGPYVSISAAENLYAVTEGGEIVSTESRGEGCPSVWEPPSGLRYTAINVTSHGGGTPNPEAWMALRSDGAVVSCGYGAGGAAVTLPPEGTTYVGVDASRFYGLAARSDGRIVTIGETALKPVQPDAGRSVVSVVAEERRGAAVLDDGTLLSWGAPMNGPDLPDGSDKFLAVSDTPTGEIYGIWDHQLVPVTLTVVDAPGDVPYGDVPVVEVDVQSQAGYVPSGRLCGLTDIYQHPGAHCVPVSGAGITSVPLKGDSQGDPIEVGEADYQVWFVSRVSDVASVAGSFTELPRVGTVLTGEGPAGWSRGDDGIYVNASLLTASGEPLGNGLEDGGSVEVYASCSSEWLGTSRLTWPGREVSVAVNTSMCAPGEYELSVRYEPNDWSNGRASTAVIGRVRVREGAMLSVNGELAGWKYGVGRSITVSAAGRRSGAPAVTGPVELYWQHRRIATGSLVAGTVTAALAGTSLTHGPGRLEVRYLGNEVFGPQRWTQPLSVALGTFPAVTVSTGGTAKVGSVMTVATGTWPAATRLAYQWRANGVPLSGATASMLSMTASMLGKQISVTVTATHAEYATKSVTSAARTVAPGTFTAAVPKISGTAKVGKTLTASRGTWSPTPSTVTYIWKAGSTVLKSGTSSSLTIPASARGKRITVTVRGSRTGWTTLQKTSAASAIVASGTFSAPAPSISGTYRVGGTIKAVRGTWTPPPSSVKYVWRINGAFYKTTSGSKITVPAKARRKTITVTVVGSRAGYTTKKVTSKGVWIR